MKIDKRVLFIASFIVSVCLGVVGAWMKIVHYPGADNLFIATLIATLVYMIIGIYEVRTSEKIDHIEKTMWTIGFIAMASITALIYLLQGRKRVVETI